jgi:Xaa-Pro aminopeptidase
MNHLKDIASRLEEFGLDAMFVNSEPGERYAVGFYGEGVAVVTRDRAFYLTDSRYIEAAEKAVTGAVILMTGRGTPQGKLLSGILSDCGIRRLGFEDGYMTVSAHRGYASALSCELVSASKLLASLLSVRGRRCADC